MENNKETKTQLEEFLQYFEQIPADLTTALLKAAADEDEKNIINSFAPVLSNQFRELSLQIRDASAKATLQHQQDVEIFLRVSSGVVVAKSLKLALPSIGSLVGNFGITQIIFTIKKIIRRLFPRRPAWLETVLDIIDEIINSGVAGSSIKMKNMLSQAEQNFLKESRLVVLLEKAHEDKQGSDDDEDDEK
ncbi:MAG: hypothetical protein JWN76_468 [Chitinophagaceae bacterium]|nr:hypothetical protein [Chitinophagaceae bacterium]